MTQQSTELVKALLMKKAFPNDQITKANKKLSMAKVRRMLGQIFSEHQGSRMEDEG